MKVYVEGTDDPKDEQQRLLPDFVEGERVFSKDIEGKQHFTQPPPRYTEARLVKTLEELGIGRSIDIRSDARYDSKTQLCDA
ncbi:MAG: hypothetical protein KatS3mg080_0155 [Anoxybacillus sp.]|nr:MAG: hypothetical protein KatS3mg080_0155 [Anoxybacillus sp.]